MAAAVISVMKGTKLHLGDVAPAGVDVDCQINQAELACTTEQPTYDTVCGRQTLPGVETWVLNLVVAQDWSTDGVSMFLFENAGQQVAFSMDLLGLGDPKAVGTCYVQAGAFGGTAGQPLAATVALPVIGRPTITPST
jgi:hypothetical protein